MRVGHDGPSLRSAQQRRAHISWLVVTPDRPRRPDQPASVAESPSDQGAIAASPARPSRQASPHGGYVWAVHGSPPSPDAGWPIIAARLATKFAAVASSFTPAQVAAVDRLLRSPDRRALRAIAALAMPFGGRTLSKHLLMGKLAR